MDVELYAIQEIINICLRRHKCTVFVPINTEERKIRNKENDDNDDS